MGLLETDLQPGDHLCVRRHGLFYSHHGIYMGNGRVVHYTGQEGKEKKNPNVKETGLEEFLRGGTLKRRNYKKRHSPTETLKVVERYLADDNYSLLFNNCEHFATYCVTGRRKSRQIKQAVGGVAVIMGAIAGIAIRKRKQNRNTT